MSMEAKRIINGTYGRVILDGEDVSEAFGLQAKINFKYEDVPICGKLGTDKKMVGYDGTGSLKMHKVNTRMGIKIVNMLKQGKEIRFTIMSELNDPDSYGSERAVLKGVLMNDLTIADWQAAQKGQIEAPFTFSDVDYIDAIQPQ